MSNPNEIIAKQGKEIETLRNALYATSEDISSALLWLNGFESASDRITEARVCLRKHQEQRRELNVQTDAIKTEAA